MLNERGGARRFGVVNGGLTGGTTEVILSQLAELIADTVANAILAYVETVTVERPGGLL